MSNTDFKTLLGFGKSNHRTYDDLRKRIQSYMNGNGIVNKTQAGDQKWSTLIGWVVGHPYMSVAQQKVRERHVDEDIMQKAVHFLCLSCSKSNSITSRERNQSRT